MTQPRVAVIGGGIAGTLCSLVLKNRGIRPTILDAGSQVGGRLRRTGAQFIRATDPRLATVIGFLEREGLVSQWKGRFGLLGSAGGGFLPADIVTQNANPAQEDGDTPPASVIDGGDFCRFVEGSTVPTFVGVPSMAELCRRICERAGIETISQCTMTKAHPLKEGGWTPVLDDKILENPSFDALVIATHDPSIAAGAIRSIVAAETQANPQDGDASLVTGRLSEIADSLQRVRDDHKHPIYTVSLTYPTEFSTTVPFDAVSVPGSSTVQFLARESSKPGRTTASDQETWTAVTTSQLAQSVLSDANLATDQEKKQRIESIVTHEIAQLMAPYGTIPEPTNVQSFRWGAAFSSPGLQLKEDSIVLTPWRLAICGDYIRPHNGNPLEAAALSGLEAGERTAAFWAKQEED